MCRNEAPVLCVPVLWATASTMSFVSQTAAAGKAPCSTVSAKLAEDHPRATDQTSFSARPTRRMSRSLGLGLSSGNVTLPLGSALPTIAKSR
jgi:hypothetical protein